MTSLPVLHAVNNGKPKQAQPGAVPQTVAARRAGGGEDEQESAGRGLTVLAAA